jgi:hypothetical protein
MSEDAKKKTQMLTTRLDIEDYNELKEMAKERFQSINQIVRMVLHNFIEETKKM